MKKEKVGAVRRVTRLAGSPFLDGRVTPIAGPTFLHINTLARPAGSTRSMRGNQSMRERCWLGQRVNFFLVETLSRDNFSLYKQGLRQREFLLIVSTQ